MWSNKQFVKIPRLTFSKFKEDDGSASMELVRDFPLISVTQDQTLKPNQKPSAF